MSLDFVEDAIDCLEKSGMPYVLVVGHGNRSLVFSNLTDEDKEMLREWIEEGEWNNILEEHLGL